MAAATAHVLICPRSVSFSTPVCFCGFLVSMSHLSSLQDVKSNTAALENLTREMNEIKQVLLANLQPQTFTILNVDEAGAGASPINLDTEDVENGEGEVNFDFPDLN